MDYSVFEARSRLQECCCSLSLNHLPRDEDARPHLSKAKGGRLITWVGSATDPLENLTIPPRLVDALRPEPCLHERADVDAAGVVGRGAHAVRGLSGFKVFQADIAAFTPNNVRQAGRSGPCHIAPVRFLAGRFGQPRLVGQRPPGFVADGAARPIDGSGERPVGALVAELLNGVRELPQAVPADCDLDVAHVSFAGPERDRR